MKREKLFTIGQFAALHGVNKKTLMWYDETGLFKPAAIKENGYRCYTYAQSSLFETIRLLRELDMSIPEIKGFLHNRSTESLAHLLYTKIADVDRRIARLETVRELLVHQHNACSHWLHVDFAQIEWIEQDEERLYFVAAVGQTMEEEIERVLASVKELHLNSLHDAVYGSLIPVSRLQCAEYEQYEGYFIKTPLPASGPNIHMKPRGTYLRAYCKGSWNNLPQRYREILAYAKDRGLSLYGYAYETGVNEAAIQSIDDYITQIEIPVKTPAI